MTDETDIEDILEEDIECDENEVIEDNDCDETLEEEHDIDDDDDDEEKKIDLTPTIFMDDEEADDEYESDNEEEESSLPESIKTNKVTFNILTKYEKNLLIGIRTQQIINGCVPLVDIKQMTAPTPKSIALEELKQYRIPFKIKRALPNGEVELWDLKDLIIL